MEKLIQKYFQKQGDYENHFNFPVDIVKFKSVEEELCFKFPVDYIEFLKITNGFEGFVGESYCQFNRLEEIVQNTEGYCKEFFPWAIHIGGNGGGEMYVIDKRKEKSTYGIMPCIADEEDFIPLGNEFEEFIKRLYMNDFWSKKS